MEFANGCSSQVKYRLASLLLVLGDLLFHKVGDDGARRGARHVDSEAREQEHVAYELAVKQVLKEVQVRSEGGLQDDWMFDSVNARL